MCNKSVSFLNDSKREKKPFIEILKKYIPLAKLVFYVAYLTAHFVIEVVKENFRQFFLREEKQPGQVRLMRILWKNKMDPEEIAKRQDFVTSLGEYVDIALLDNPAWHLYCVEKERAFFVLLPHPICHYRLERCPFIYVPIFEEALALAEVSKEDFIKLGKQFEEEDRIPRTVLFTNTARCGSTLMAKMLDRPGDSICFGEPHALHNISTALCEDLWTEEECKELLHPTISCLRAHAPLDQVCVLKTSSCEAKLVPLCEGIKNLKHIFMFRKQGLQSVERMNRRQEVVATVLLHLYHMYPAISRWISTRTPAIEGYWVRKLKPQDMRMWSAIVYGSPYVDFLKNKHLYCHPCIWYHEVIEDTAKTLSRLFLAIDFPFVCVEDAIECKKYDSQKNSVVSRDILRQIKTPPLTEEDRKALNKYAIEMNLPAGIFDI